MSLFNSSLFYLSGRASTFGESFHSIEDYGDDDSKIELGYENDQREILSFGFNGSCILKTGGVSKSDAKFYRGFKQKRLSCGIRKPLVSTNEKFKKIGGRKFPPDLGIVKL